MMSFKARSNPQPNCAILHSRERHTLSSEEFAGDVESFAADYNDLLTVEQLLSHRAGQATEEVSLAIDYNLMSMRSTDQLASFNM